MTRRVLVADDDDLSREFLAEALRAAGCVVDVADTGERAARLFEERRHDLVMSDVRMPDGDGRKLLARVKTAAPDTPVVLVTAYGSVETAVAVMREGAEDFILKPVTVEQIDLCLQRVAQRDSLRRENKALKACIESDRRGVNDPVGASPAWKTCLQLARRVARTRATVLIRGESGSGKEVIASMLHHASDRSARPFIRTNCAVLQDTLLTSELFGHEKGSFTSAHVKKEGRFELADGGTLLLDEIGEISPEIQAKLLRVIETGEFERVGGKETIKVDVRVVCATNRDLEKMMREGQFREDLFYRLNVVPIAVPALRDRGDDVLLIAQHFLERYAIEYGSPARELDGDARRRLLAYGWPGNVRELANLMQRVALLAPAETVGEEQLGLESRGGAAAPENLVGRSIDDVERQLILETLRVTRGNKTEAARILGVTARTLSNKLRTYRERGQLVAAGF